MNEPLTGRDEATTPTYGFLAHSRRSRRQGQILALMGVGMIAVITMIALIVDGGNLWAQQRVVQNGSDGAAEAGAVVLAQRLAGVTTPVAGWDAEVQSKVLATAAANGMTVNDMYYTDICGIPLRSNGTAALNGSGVEDLATAARVGSGLPTSAATTPDCPSITVGPPAGVLVFGEKAVGTYFAGIVGMNTVDVVNRAVAVTGYLQGFCDASEDEACAVLPVTFPVNVVDCDDHNDPVNTGVAWSRGIVYKVPLCRAGPGNVGWLDWTPPGGGTSDTVCSILHPDNPAIDLPSWNYVTETGNTNGGGGSCHMSIEEAIRTYNGEVVLIPLFDATCPSEPAPGQVSVVPNFGCPAGDLNTGHGSNNWYRFPNFAFFRLCDPSIASCSGLQGAYISGHDDECDVGHGPTSCLVGEFVDILGTGTVGPGFGGGTGSTKAIGVQLIK